MSKQVLTQPAPSTASSAGVLTWDTGTSDYVPTGEKAASTPKVFVGPTDPRTVTGVVVNAYDQWVQTGF